MVAVLGGHVDVGVGSTTVVVPHITAGKLKMILAINDERWDLRPDVPHIMEKGYDFSIFSHLGLWGPKGLPEPVRSKLEEVMHKGMQDPSLAKAAQDLQVKLRFIGGKEYSRMIKERYEGYRKIVKDLGLEEK